MNHLRSPFTAALIGGVVVALAFLIFGIGNSHKTTTVVQQSPIAAPAAAESKGLTANAIYKRDAPGVVFIQSQIVRRVQSPFEFFPEEQRSEATGSGFVLDKDGYILTNWHVIAGASKVTVSFENNKTVDAKVIGRDTSDDLALLKVPTDGLRLEPLQLGNSKTVQVGDPVLALGNPFGFARTLTQGIVSALQRQIKAPNGFTISNVIQTDAPINPGNSGGPLLDAAGRVIGINSQIATGNGSSDTGGNVGIGFAVPINTAKQVIPQLKESGKVQRAYLGITGATIDSSLAALNLKTDHGVLVQGVESGGPAEKAGIRGGDTQVTIAGNDITLGGDVIQKIDGRTVNSMDDVVAEVNNRKPGDKVALQVLRDGKTKMVTVKLAARPNSASSQ